MAEDPKIEIEDLPGGAQELDEAELDGVVGGIKDGTSNVVKKRGVAAGFRPRPVMSDPDSGDEFV